MQKIRNVAIIAHVDHGKTTLVDKMLLAGNLFKDHEKPTDLILDNNDLERERGITIVSKNVSIRYKNRASSYQKVADYIDSFIKNKVGNYFVFLPSYEYLHNLMPYIDIKDALIYEQNKEMSDEEKEIFLNNFKPSPEVTSIAFVVVGGAFGEGIDLVSDRLIGAVIVGIGMPKINFISDQISKH